MSIFSLTQFPTSPLYSNTASALSYTTNDGSIIEIPNDPLTDPGSIYNKGTDTGIIIDFSKTLKSGSSSTYGYKIFIQYMHRMSGFTVYENFIEDYNSAITTLEIIIRDILVNESYQGISCPLYNFQNDTITSVIFETLVLTNSDIDLVFKAGEKYSLEFNGGISGYKNDGSVGGVNFYNSGLVNTNSSEVGYLLGTSTPVNVPKCDLLILGTFTYGKKTTKVGDSFEDLTINNSMIDVMGGINLYLNGKFGTINNSQKTNQDSTICVPNNSIGIFDPNVLESFKSNIIVFGSGTTIYNTGARDVILIAGLADLYLYGGTIRTYFPTPALVMSTSISNTKNNLIIKDASVISTGGSVISWGTGTTFGNVLLLGGTIKSMGSIANHSSAVTVHDNMSFIMDGGLISIGDFSGSALTNSSSGTVNIYSGTLINASSTYSTIDNVSGVINIKASVTITNEVTGGRAIQNTLPAAFHLDTDAKTNGEIIDPIASNSTFLVHARNTPTHTTTILSNYTYYINTVDLTVLNRKFILDNDDYSLYFDTVNFRIQVLIKVKIKSFSNTPINGDYISWVSYVIPYSPAIYPVLSKNRGFTETYNAIDPSNPSLFKEVSSGSGIQYNIPHYVDCSLELKDQKIQNNSGTGGISALSDYSGTYSPNETLILAAEISRDSENNVISVEDSEVYFQWKWYKETNETDQIMPEKPLSGLNPYSSHQSYYLPINNVSDSGDYRVEVKISFTRFGQYYETTDSYFVHIDIQPVVIESSTISYRYSDQTSASYTNGILEDRVAQVTPYTLEFFINPTLTSLDGSSSYSYVLNKESYGINNAKYPDYSVLHEKNVYSGTATATFTLSENFITELNSRTKKLSFNILPDEIERLEVVYVDEKAKIEYQRIYNAFEKLNTTDIRLVVHYASHKIEVNPNDLKILYERFDDNGNITYSSEDYFFAINDGFNNTVKFTYMEHDIIFPSSDTDTLLKVNKLDTGVYMHVPDNTAVTSEALGKYAHNPNGIPGQWEFDPASIVTNSSTYHWSFIPDDAVNFATILNDEIFITPFEAEATSITIEAHGIYKYKAFDLFSVDSVKVWLNYNDEGVGPVDVTSNARVLYYHGSTLSASAVENFFYSMNNDQILDAENDRFLAGDNFVVIMYTPWDNSIMDYGSPFFSAFMLTTPVSKIKPDTTLSFPNILYASTALNSLILESEFTYWDVEWRLVSDVVTHPKPGTNNYSYTFIPKDSYNYDTVTSEAWISSLDVFVTDLEITHYDPIFTYITGQRLPEVSELLNHGVIFTLYFNDGDSKIADENDLFLEYAPVYREGSHENYNFIGKHTYFVVVSSSNVAVRVNMPIRVNLQNYAAVNIIVPTDIVDGKCVYNDLDHMPIVESDSIDGTTEYYDEKGLQVNYYLADSRGSFVYGSGSNRKSYRLISGTELIIKNVGSYEILFLYVGDPNYYNIPTADIVSFEIIEYDPWGDTYDPSITPPILSEATIYDGYWNLASMPSLSAPASFDIDDQDIINFDVGAHFYWTIDYRQVNTFDLLDFTSSPIQVSYTWHWVRQNYKSQTGTIDINVYNNVIKKIYAEFISEKKEYFAEEIIDLENDGIKVYGIFEDGHRVILESTHFSIVYNGGYQDGVILPEFNGKGLSGGTTPVDATEQFYLKGDHTMVAFIADGKLSGQSIEAFSLYITVHKLTFQDPTFLDKNVLLDVEYETAYSVQASYDPRLDAQYYTYSASYDESAPNIDSYHYDGDGLNDPFRGWYDAFIPISAPGVHKILAVFDIIDSEVRRDYYDVNPKTMYLSIKRNLETFVTLDQDYILDMIYYYGDLIPINLLDDVNANASSFVYSDDNGDVLVPGQFKLILSYFSIAGNLDNSFLASYRWVWTPSDTPILSDPDSYTYLNIYMPVMGTIELKVVGIKDFIPTLKNNSASVKAGSSVLDSVDFVTIIYDDDSERIVSDWKSNIEIFEMGITQVTFRYDFDIDSLIPSLTYVQNYTVSLNANLVTIDEHLEKQYTGLEISIESDCLNLTSDFLVEYTLDGISYYTNLSDVIDRVTVGYQREFSIRISREYYETNYIDVTLSIYSDIILIYDGINDKTRFSFYNRTAPDFDFNPGVPVLDNYDFTGWYTTPTGTAGGIRISDASGNLIATWNDTPSLTLYARFTGIKLTVVFDPNGIDVGIHSVPNRSITYNSVIALLESGWEDAVIVRHLYIKGWTLDEGSSDIDYLPGESYLVLSNITFYAVWDDASYDVKFNLDGGEFINSPDLDNFTNIISGNSTLGLPIDVVKSQYSFSGWMYSDQRGNLNTINYSGLLGQLNINGNLDFTFFNIGFSNGKNVEINLTAVWTENTYTINFLPNGGTGTMAQLVHKASNLNTVFPNLGYGYLGNHFIGWATSPSVTFESIIYTDADILFSDINNYVALVPGVYDYSLSLYAIWEVNTYPLIFIPNAEDASGNMYPVTLTYGTPFQLPQNTFERKDWAFSGWAVRSTATNVTYTDGDTVLNLTLTDGKAVYLYAVWTTLSYTVEFNANGGDGTMLQHTFTISDGGKLTKNIFTRPGYSFDGWSLSNTGASIVLDEAMHSELSGLFLSQTPTLYASWSALTYSFNFEKNSNATGNMESTNFLYSDVLPNSVFYMQGYLFNGWLSRYQDIESSTTYAVGGNISSIVLFYSLEYDTTSPVISLIADWVPVKYYVVFNSNGGTGTMASQELTYDSDALLSTNLFTKTGFNFVSWNTQFDGQGSSYLNGDSVLNLSSVNLANINLYAEWSAVTFNITYMLDGGDISGSETILVTYGDIITLPIPDKTGFTFQNWMTGNANSSDLTPEYYYGSLNSSNLSSTQDDEIYLWANYIAEGGRGIAYYSNGGVGHIAPQIDVIGTHIELSNGAGFTRAGYIFLGWSTDYSATTPDLTDYPINWDDSTNYEYIIIDSLISLYAVWNKITYSVTIYQDDSNQIYVNRSVQYAEPYDFSDAILSRTGYTFTGFITIDNVTFATSGIFMGSRNIILKSVWRAHVSTIVFDANGGFGSMAPLTGITYDTEVHLTLNEGQIQKTGYSFNGWNTTRNGDGINRPNGGNAIVSSLDGAVVTLYAKWQAIQYRIVFDANSGSGSMDAQSLVYDSESNLNLNQFEKAGYFFSSWNTLRNGKGTSYNNYQNVTNLTSSAQDFNLFAIWSPITYIVNFNANGGSGTMNAQTFTYDSLGILARNEFALTGYTFVSWTSETDTIFNDEAEIFNLTNELNAEINLLAYWQENSYYINFNPNGGIGEMAVQGPILYTEVVNVSTNSISKTGYQFKGWSLDGSNLAYLDGSTLDSALSAEDGGIVTFYALWEANEYSINYYPNTAFGTTITRLVKYDQSFSIMTLAESGFSKTGYRFVNWNTNPAPSSEGNSFEAGEVLSNLLTSGTFNLYAVWDAITYKIHFVGNEGLGYIEAQDAIFNSLVTLEENSFVRPTFYFTGWSEEVDGAIVYSDKASISITLPSDITLYAQWALIQYGVRYDKNLTPGAIINGDPMPNSLHTYGVLKPLSVATYTREGYSLIGWADNAGADEMDHSLHYSASILTDTNNTVVTLYAVWKINSYTVTYIGNGATTAIGTATYQYGAIINSPIVSNTSDNIPLRPGFLFKYWTLTQTDGSDENLSEYEFGDSMPSYDIVLYAVWTKSEIRYIITLDPAGGIYTGATEIVLSYDEYITLAQTPTKGGYDFVGWFRDNQSTPFTANRMPAENFQLTAKWTEQIVTIVFESFGGGNFANVVGRYNYSTFDVDSNIPELSGYQFSGWYSDQDFNNKVEGVQTIDYNVTKLYAKWDKIKIVIAYDSNGGNEISQSLRAVEIEPGSAFPNPPLVTRDGYTFTGWYLNQSLTIPSNYETVPEFAVLLYAGWSVIPSAKASVPGWAIALIVILVVLVIAAIVVAIVLMKKREGLWKSR
ncbi:MAG: InlB B-repeat-containing protein [Christensenellaceae bacterium]|nr:InlB B-repeat-containing protein [Christensenellaceae bacterium]